MSKKIKNIKKYTIKKVTLDPLYKSYWYSKFLNKFMLNGKKHVIEKIMTQVFYKFKVKYNHKAIWLLFVTLLRLKPVIGFISKRVGKIWKSVPTTLAPRRQLVLALKWVVAQIKLEPDITLSQRLIRTWTLLLRKKLRKKHSKISDVILRKKRHYFAAVTNRTNLRYRWS